MQGLVASGCLVCPYLIIYMRARNGQSGVGETPGKKGGSARKVGVAFGKAGMALGVQAEQLRQTESRPASGERASGGS